jgi:MFS family permease
MFPEPREQAKAIGIYGFVASAGASVGLLAGGVLTQVINWHWIFFINIPIGIATGVLAMRLLEKDRGVGVGKGADVLGAVLITASLMLLVYTIVEPAAVDGWAATRTLAMGAGSLVLLVAFLVREATASNPLVPLRIFRSRNVAGANAIQALFVAGMFAMFFMGALYLQSILGYSALETGLAFLPSTIVMGTLSIRYSQPLVMRYGARATLLPGLVLGVAGLSLFTLSPVDGSYVTHVLPVMVLLGAGAGIAFPALMTLAMSGASPSDAGLASGLVNTTVQVGGAIGLAVLATLASSETGRLREGGESALAALNGGYHLAYLIGAGLIVAAIAVALVVLRPERQAAPALKPAYSEGV